MRKIAVVFPGQGSQCVGMLSGLEDHPSVRKTLEEADSILGYSISEIIARGPQEVLNQTVHTQPALVVSCVAVYRALAEKTRLIPTYFAGHSLGEFAACAASGLLSFADTVRLVRLRAERMQEIAARHPGHMVAVLGLAAKDIDSVCSRVEGEGFVKPVNFNAPLQTVIAGIGPALDRAKDALKEAGAKMIVDLPVAAAFHTDLFTPVARALKDTLQTLDIHTAATPVVANIDGSVKTTKEDIVTSLSEQVSHPVQWVKTQDLFLKNGVTDLIECGPGRTLTGLAKRTLKGITLFNASSAQSIESIAAQFATE